MAWAGCWSARQAAQPGRAGDDTGGDGFIRIAGAFQVSLPLPDHVARTHHQHRPFVHQLQGGDGGAGLAKAHLGVQDAVPSGFHHPVAAMAKWRWTSNRPRSSLSGQRRQAFGSILGALPFCLSGHQVVERLVALQDGIGDRVGILGDEVAHFLSGLEHLQLAIWCGQW